MKLFATYGQVAGKLVPVFYFITGIVMLGYPFAIYLFTEKLSLPYGFILPWIDHKTTVGYCLNYFFHMIQTYYVVVGFSFTDMTYVILVINLYALHVIMNTKLTEIEKLIIDKNEALQLGKNPHANELKIQEKFGDFLKVHTKTIKLFRMLENTFRFNFFFMITSLIFQITVTLFAIMERNWGIGYVLVWILMSQILILCVSGQILINKVVQIDFVIYQNFSKSLIITVLQAE